MRNGASIPLVAVLVAALAPAAAAHAQSRTSTEVDYRMSGKLTARWIAAGGERGTLTQTLSQAGDIALDADGSSSSGSTFSFGGSADEAVVRVERDLPGGGVARCVDAPRYPAGFDVEPEGRRWLAFRVGGDLFDFRPPEFSAARCAGPVSADILPHLPRGRFDLRRVRRGPSKLRKRSREAFAAGGVRGELVSDVVVRLSRARVRRSGRGRAEAGQAQSPDRVYSIAGVAGSLSTTFAGGAEPGCRLLDACGAEGSVSVALGKVDGGVELVGGAEPNTLHSLTAEVTAASRMTRPDGPGCADTVVQRAAFDLAIRPLPGGAFRLELRAAGGGPDPWRTHCAGPASQDLAGEAIAVGDIPRRALGRPSLDVVLRAGGGLRGTPYTGTLGGELTMRLERP